MNIVYLYNVIHIFFSIYLYNDVIPGLNCQGKKNQKNYVDVDDITDDEYETMEIYYTC